MHDQMDRKGPDITDCDKEPIHIPGAVQAHGMLIALRSSDFTILQISENVFELLGVHPSELLHQPLSRIMNLEPIEKASYRLGDRTPRLLNPIPLEINVRGQIRHFDGILHRSGRSLILELETHIQDQTSYGGFGGFYETVREVISKIMLTETLDEVFSTACEEIRKMTGFSRVLVYKFDESWNGKVISESKDEDVKSLLHHRFPANDIPKQARELYATNWLRLIPNANYKPSKVVPSINPITDRPLDMSNSVLRSVSPIHLEYMRNMGQTASMSVSLIKGRQLWGLIACHHPDTKYLKYDVRVAAEFIGQIVSGQIVSREESHEVDHRMQLKSIYGEILRNGGDVESVPAALKENFSFLLALAEANGVAVRHRGGIDTFGLIPETPEIEKIIKALSAQDELIASTHQLELALPEATNWRTTAAGAAMISIPQSNLQIVWFRPELKEQIPWSGNPHLSKEVSADGRLHPRKSFETWMEVVSGCSTKWGQAELDAIGELRTLIADMTGDEAIENPEAATRPAGFRKSLAKAIATTEATQESREPSSGEVARPSSMHEATQNSRMLLEGFAEFAVIFLDLEGQIQNWSAGARRLLGYSRHQAAGQTLQMFLSEEETLKGKPERILSHVREKGRCEEEMWLYRSDETSFWGKIMVAQVRDDSDRLIGFSMVIQDVTKEKAAEEELKATKVAAEAANQAKSAFLANISHEIRTPLGAILGFAELLSAEHQTQTDREELYSRVKRNGVQLTSLINDLLDLTKVEANRLEVELIEFDFASLLVDVYETLGFKAAEKSLDFKVEILGQLPNFIVSDPTRLRQVLVNLITNAIKFTERGGSVKVICSMEDVGQGKRLAIRVQDTGRGMSESEMGKLFQPFVQADVSTTRKYGGTGLGLFVSQRIARLLNGDLSIESSAPGKGSTFLAFIDPGSPASKSVFSKLAPQRDLPVLNKLNNEELRGLRILIVDDSQDNRHLIAVYLKKAGAEVLTAENGIDGVQAAIHNDVDLVLMDIQMPILDGNAAMQRLKELNYKKPVVALTAHAMHEERDFSLTMGFRDYLTKPINRDVLVRTIRELTSKTSKL